jgi:hypothetical protein
VKVVSSLLDKLTLRDLTQTPDDVAVSEGKPTQQRTTRQQMAKTQAGQYDLGFSLETRGRSVGLQRQIDRDYITSLFGGRSTGSSRGFSHSVQAARYRLSITDQTIFLAEEEIAKTMREAANVESVNLVRPAEVAAKWENDASRKNETIEDHVAKSPTKAKTLEEVEKACEVERAVTPTDPAGEDSFVDQITSRSPAKPVSRIEDSVEALDRLEEALEALDQAALAERMVSPENTRHNDPVQQAARSKAEDSKVPMDKIKAAHGQNPTKQTTKPGYASMRVKPTAPKQTAVVKKTTSMIFRPSESREESMERAGVENVKGVNLATKKAPVKRPVSLLPPKEPVKSTKPATRPTFELPGEAIARKLKEQREARLAQRESSEDSCQTARVSSAPKIKSTKPPTKPTFELPGEAVSRRKREAHEARLKAQEEEERKRREFKARPVRKSVLPSTVPRDTVASRGRQSKVGLENIEDGSLPVSKRGSTVGVHRLSILQLNMANISAPRAPGPPVPLVRKPSTASSGPSVSGLAIQRTVSAHEVQAQRQRAKEIYNRDAKFAEDVEREKREREAAAKKSREEAAERGRQASREWAEKQRAKKMAGGDKGMSAGYGPGGQMGLKA